MPKTVHSKARRVRPTTAAAAAVFALGVGSQLSQIVLVRELLMLFHGNELTIGIVLAAWLLWVGVGSGCGAFLARRASHPLRCVSLAALNLLWILPGTLVFLRGARRVLGGVPGAWLSIRDTVVISLPALMPVGLIWGAGFVLLARLWRERLTTPRHLKIRKRLFLRIFPWPSIQSPDRCCSSEEVCAEPSPPWPRTRSKPSTMWNSIPFSSMRPVITFRKRPARHCAIPGSAFIRRMDGHLSNTPPNDTI